MSQPTALQPFTPYQRFMIAALAFLQFTVILDFMIMSPLGAAIMPALNITPSQFGFVVSVYAFSAGASGLLAAGWADRFDRKRFLVVFYAGFMVGTLLCGIAPTYEFLLFARMVAGIFGGVIGAIGAAIITDIFVPEQRGRVMGIMQTAFAASQILGLPAGLYFSNHWGWQSPFLVIVALGVIAGLIIFTKMQPITEHLKLQGKANALQHFWGTVRDTRYTLAFIVTALLSIGGYMLMPFGSAFSIHNLGVGFDELPFVYLVTGISTIVIAPLMGRLTDKLGPMPVFTFGSVLSMVTVFVYTHLGVTPLPFVMLVNVIMFVSIFSRMIPSQTMLSTLPSPASRGAYMSVSASLQQIAGGVAAVIAGALVSQSEGGRIEHFERIGYSVMGTALVCLVLLHLIHKQIKKRKEMGL